MSGTSNPLPNEIIQCALCQKFKPQSAYYMRSTRRKGIKDRCKECVKISAREYTKINKKDIELKEVIECRCCGVSKPWQQFDEMQYRANRTKVCFVCREKYCKDHNIDRSQRYRLPAIMVIDGKKHCGRCDRVLPVSEFGKNMAAPYSLDWNCKDCCKTKRNAFIASTDSIYWKYRAKNTKVWGDLRISFIKELFAKSPNCYYCGYEFAEKAEAHLDHKTPRSKGGETTPENVCFACERCNRSKDNMTELEYVEWLETTARRVLKNLGCDIIDDTRLSTFLERKRKESGTVSST